MITRFAQWSGCIMVFNTPSVDGRMVEFADGKFPWAKLPVPLMLNTSKDLEGPYLPRCVGTVAGLVLGTAPFPKAGQQGSALYASGWLDLNVLTDEHADYDTWDLLEDGEYVGVSAAIGNALIREHRQDEVQVFHGDWELKDVFLGSRKIWPGVGIRLNTVHYRMKSPIPPEWIRS